MALIHFKAANGKDAWIDPALVSLVRDALDGEKGQTFIWCNGVGIFLADEAATVVRALEGGRRGG